MHISKNSDFIEILKIQVAQKSKTIQSFHSIPVPTYVRIRKCNEICTDKIHSFIGHVTWL